MRTALRFVLLALLLVVCVGGCTEEEKERAAAGAGTAADVASGAAAVVGTIDKTIGTFVPPVKVVTTPLYLILSLIGGGLYAVKRGLQSKKDNLEVSKEKGVMTVAKNVEARNEGSVILKLLSSRKFSVMLVSIIGSIALALWKIEVDKEVVLKIVEALQWIAVVVIGGTALEDYGEKRSGG